ncbi:DNA-binding helix-turn-helix protein [Chlorella virus XW01]|nr:DNA-binding helix-turn-helix protein [Chlorella virus XW01]
MAGNWKDMLLKKNIPIFETKPNLRKVIPKEIVDSNIVKVKPQEEKVKETKVEYYGIRGNEILRLRNEKKLTQKELANRLSMHSSDLQHIESGKAVFNNGTYKRIVNYLSSL